MTTARKIAPTVEALIMAGGRGERLYPLTASRPKPAVPFGGMFRIVDFTLSNCLKSGLSRVSLLTQYKHEELQSYIQHSWGELWTERARESLVCLPPDKGKRYRGTADAVFQNLAAVQHRESDFVLILAADHVYHMDYRDLLRYHAETNADLTISTVEQPPVGPQRFDVVEVDDERRVVGFQERPSHPCCTTSRSHGALISMGIYVFKRKVLTQALNESRHRNPGCDFGHHIIPSLVGSADVRAYDFRSAQSKSSCYWRDIGTLDSYYETSMDLVRPEKPFDPFVSEQRPLYPAHFPNTLPDSAHLRANCRVTRSILSPGVRIDDGSLIDSSVLMSGVWVGREARIRHAIIEEGVHIPAGFQIGFDLENDRKHYFVTGAGVVVVSETPKHIRPTLVRATTEVRPRPVSAFRAA